MANRYRLQAAFSSQRNLINDRPNQILSAVWGYDYDPGSNIVNVYIGDLRKKLSSHIIETVRGMRYRFVSK